MPSSSNDRDQLVTSGGALGPDSRQTSSAAGGSATSVEFEIRELSRSPPPAGATGHSSVVEDSHNGNAARNPFRDASLVPQGHGHGHGQQGADLRSRTHTLLDSSTLNTPKIPPLQLPANLLQNKKSVVSQGLRSSSSSASSNAGSRDRLDEFGHAPLDQSGNANQHSRLHRGGSSSFGRAQTLSGIPSQNGSFPSNPSFNSGYNSGLNSGLLNSVSVRSYSGNAGFGLGLGEEYNSF